MSRRDQPGPVNTWGHSILVGDSLRRSPKAGTRGQDRLRDQEWAVHFSPRPMQAPSLGQLRSQHLPASGSSHAAPLPSTFPSPPRLSLNLKDCPTRTRPCNPRPGPQDSLLTSATTLSTASVSHYYNQRVLCMIM